MLVNNNHCGCSDTQRIWTCQNCDQKLEFEFLMANFVKNGHFWGSGMTCDRVLFVLVVMRAILDPKKKEKWSFSTKLAIKIQIFFVKIKCPNSLSVRASTDVKSGQKFQLEPG